MTHPSIHARAHPNRIAYRMAAAAKAISYREFDELSNQGAHLFRALGLKAGDHIALLMENRLAFMEMLGRAAQRALVHRDQPVAERGRARLYRQRLGRQGFHHLAEMRRAG
jgi:long-chain acyl-CoA synthetase